MNPAAEHPMRYGLVNELHARPSPRLSAPATAVFLAFKEPGAAANRDRARDHDHLCEIVSRHGGPRPDPDSSHYQGRLGRHDLKWESHTEFVTYMATVPGLPLRPFDPSAAAIFSEAWQDAAPGRRIAAAMVQIDLLPDDPAEIPGKIADWFAGDSLAAVWVLEESAVIASDFRIDAAGWMRFAVFVRNGVEPSRLGRLIHRLVELETYRAVSMLGLGRARALTARLNALEVRLSALIESMADESRPAEEVLHDLLPIVTELEAQAAQHGFRFGATRAYQAIVSDRIEMLRETRFLQMQMLTEFMRRRYLPAMRTTESAANRLAEMMARATRSGELLRTRVEVERRAQNQKIMERMDRRAEMQLRLQHTVEGLSVVAISYYAVGLLAYVLAPLASAAGFEKSVLVAAMTPVVVLVAWLGMRRLRHSLHSTGQGDL